MAMNLTPIFEKLNWQYKEIAKGYILNCPFAEFTHPKKVDRNPSCVVWPSRNFWKCYSCGERGTLEELFRKYEFFTKIQVDFELDALEGMLLSLDSWETGLQELDENCLKPFDKGRDYILGSPLWQDRQFDPRVIDVFDLRANKDYLIFPVRMNNILYGAVGRSFVGKKIHNFFGFPTGKTLGGLDQIQNNKRIGIVEGMTCLLRGWHWAQEIGYDMVCTWTANLTKDQANLLSDTGKVIHCWFDQDVAGTQGWKRLEGYCGSDYGLTRHIWGNPKDVGQMTKEQFQTIFNR